MLSRTTGDGVLQAAYSIIDGDLPTKNRSPREMVAFPRDSHLRVLANVEALGKFPPWLSCARRNERFRACRAGLYIRSLPLELEWEEAHGVIERTDRYP